MQQRQLRLGDILDDYCPRERRVTNHAVVAMVGPDVKQTRCTTCDAEHEYKHAKVPRQRRKAEGPAALYSQVLASGPKRVAHEDAGNGNHGSQALGDEGVESGSAHEEIGPQDAHGESADGDRSPVGAEDAEAVATAGSAESAGSIDEGDAIEPSESDAGEMEPVEEEEGPVHRPLI